MRKYLILLCLIFMTGCSARYTIEFNDDTIDDNISIFSIESSEYEYIKSDNYAPIPAFVDSPFNVENPVKIKGVEYYDVDAHNGNAYLDYKFKLSDYENSYFANTCYDYFKIFEEKDEIVFSTGKKFKCFFPGYDLDSVDVVIKSNHTVLYNNADEINDGEYVWHITKDKKDDANIQISFSKDYKKKRLKINFFHVFIYLGIGVGIIFLISLLIIVRYRRVNKI